MILGIRQERLSCRRGHIAGSWPGCDNASVLPGLNQSCLSKARGHVCVSENIKDQDWKEERTNTGSSISIIPDGDSTRETCFLVRC